MTHDNYIHAKLPGYICIYIQIFCIQLNSCNVGDRRGLVNIQSNTMSEIESKFKIFDKTGDGFITKDEVGYVIRSMGFAPTDGQVNECIKKW